MEVNLRWFVNPPMFSWFVKGTPLKSNELIPKIAKLKRSHLFQSIILGIHVSFGECIWIYSLHLGCWLIWAPDFHEGYCFG